MTYLNIDVGDNINIHRNVIIGNKFCLIFKDNKKETLFKGAFDLPKNEGHDRIISVVQCLIYKTVSGTGQT